MASPLDLILGATEPLGQLAAAYEANQPVSGAKAQLLDYLYKSVNSGAMSPQEAQVMYQAEQQGIMPPPRMEPAVPVQPQPAAGLSAQPGTAANAIAAAPPAPAPTFAAPPPPAPAAAPGLAAAPVPAPAPAPAPAAATAAPPVEVSGGLAVPPKTVAPPLPANAAQAREALSFGTPKFNVEQTQIDASGYEQARRAVAATLGKEKPPVPMTLDVSKVTNRDFDMVKTMLSDILKTRDSSKQAMKIAELQANISRDEMKARARANMANMDATNRARMTAMKLEQDGDIAAAKIMYDYYALNRETSSREFIARLNNDPAYLNAMIALIGRLEGVKGDIIASGMGITPEGQAEIADAAKINAPLITLLQQLIKNAGSGGGVGGSSGTVTGTATSGTQPAGATPPAPPTPPAGKPATPTPPPAPKPPKPKPAPKPAPTPAPAPAQPAAQPPPGLSGIQLKIWQAQQKKKQGQPPTK